MRLYYEISGFATASSFTVDGDRLFLFNDPHCLYDVGEYTWELAEGASFWARCTTNAPSTCGPSISPGNRGSPARLPRVWARPRGGRCQRDVRIHP
jgi:hypothetical protein